MTENTLNKEFLVALENCRSFKRPLTPDQVDQLYKALDLADMIIHPKARKVISGKAAQAASPMSMTKGH